MDRRGNIPQYRRELRRSFILRMEWIAKVLNETEPVTIEVIAVHKAPVGGKLLALVDVSITIHGIEFKVRGLRVSRENMNGQHATSVTAPLHRDNGGHWKATITFPQELHDPLSDIVLNACIEQGICRRA